MQRRNRALVSQRSKVRTSFRHARYPSAWITGAPINSGRNELDARKAIIDTIPLMTKNGWGTPQTIAGRVSPRKSGSEELVLSIEYSHNAGRAEDADDAEENRAGMGPGDPASERSNPPAPD